MSQSVATRPGALFRHRLLGLLRVPLNLVSLLSKACSFRNNPLIGSHFLNRLGLHVSRVLLARGLTRLRWWMLSPLVPREYRDAFQRDGFLLLEDFLPAEMFSALEAELRSYRGEAWEMVQGNTLTQHVFLDGEVLPDLPTTGDVLAYPKLRRLLRYAGSHLSLPRMYLQRIANGYGRGQGDPQKKLHLDTFHPTIKMWLFLDDVGADRGPFTYVPGSHRLSLKRLAWEYRQSLSARESENPHHAHGAFRVTAEDLRELALPAPRAVTARRNTLVIANTVGIHRRGDAKGQISRLELWGTSRKNPFLPFPGFEIPGFRRLESRIVRWVTRSREQQATHDGVDPLWRTVPFNGALVETGRGEEKFPTGP